MLNRVFFHYTRFTRYSRSLHSLLTLFTRYSLVRMSVHVKISTLNETQQKEITKEAQIVPIPKLDESITRKMSSKQRLISKAPDPFSFLISKDGFALIPYFLAIQKKVETDFSLHKPLSDEIIPLLKNSKLRDYQVDIVDKCLDQLASFSTTTISAPPGAGKTFMCTTLAGYTECKTCILYPSKISTLSDQWRETINVITNSKAIIYEPDTPAKEKKKEKKRAEKIEEINFDFLLTTEKRLSSLPPILLSQIGTFIIDEAHILATRGCISSLLSLRPNYIILSTATLERPDGQHKMMHLLAGEHKVTIEAKKSFIFSPFFIPVKGEETLSKCDTLDYNNLTKSICSNEVFNTNIIDKIIELREQKRKIIVLGKSISHLNHIHSLLSLKLDETIETMWGSKKIHKDSFILLGTTSKISTGYDAEKASVDYLGFPADTLIILNSMTEKTQFTQAVGRVLRQGTLFTPLVVFCVCQNRVYKRHLTKIRSYVEELGGVEK